uniref:Putative secreted protein n=1 Tax=Anopheles triannulatus TaxID=58253 RepID=A0A2M4B765_9DIPT
MFRVAVQRSSWSFCVITLINATPCSSVGTLTRSAELIFGQATVPAAPAPDGLAGGEPDSSSSAFVTSNMPGCMNLEPAVR